MHEFMKRWLIGFSILMLCSCKQELSEDLVNQELSQAIHFHNSLDILTDIIVHDIFSPPVASRVYVYPCIAAYQCLYGGSADDLSNRLNGLGPTPTPPNEIKFSKELAALESFFIVSKKLIFSEETIDAYTSNFYHKLDSIGIPKVTIDNSKAYGQEMAKVIIAWADKDTYNQSRSFPKFSLTDNPSDWQPTPPAYIEGIEPHWNQIRTLVLDSAQQFKPKPPPEFSLDKSSVFYALTQEVYNTVNTLDEEKTAIASFWDCNPYVMNQTGHMMFAIKKITPGGHWMGISNIASRTANQTFEESVRTSTLVAISLFDSFISCWDEKYRSKLVRPETVINKEIDEEWIPILQTPPFPEHTSGHSVISTAAAVTLTKIFGDDFKYVDDVELKYGLPIRKFNSFREASAEAAISRLYGGIHYMPAISEGVIQGEEIGRFITEKLKI